MLLHLDKENKSAYPEVLFELLLVKLLSFPPVAIDLDIDCKFSVHELQREPCKRVLKFLSEFASGKWPQFSIGQIFFRSIKKQW